MVARLATFAAVLTARSDAGAGLALVTLSLPPERAGAYRAPGQYIEVRAGGAKGYFVLAGEVGAPSWELLVRRNGGASDVLALAPERSEFIVGGPLGRGFPLERAYGRPLIVAVAGSALSVARPILRDRIAQRQAPSTNIYVGVRTPTEVPLATEVAGWVRAGARVVLCLSRGFEQKAYGPLAEARRVEGYVQKIVNDDFAKGLLNEGVVFAAGPASMLEELRTLGRTRPSTLEVFTNS